MEVKITNQKENPLLKRKEIAFEVDHKDASTPSKKDVRNKLAALLAANEKLLIVDGYASSVGTSVSCGSARLYSDEKMLACAETKPTVRKNLENKTKKEKKSAGGSTAEAPAATTKPAKAGEEKKK